LDNIRSSYHLVMKTPFGFAALLYRKNPFEIVKIMLPRPNKKELTNSIDGVVWGKSGAHQEACAISKSIIDYFMGKPLPNDWPPLAKMDMGALTELQKSVMSTTAAIPYGELRTYKEIARAINRPLAYRFVGTALAKNPFPILIPCHRVIRSDLSPGQYGGGADLKKKLIRLEAEQKPF